MCVALPGRVTDILERGPASIRGVVSFGSVEREVELALTPEVSEGDYVVVHAGFAVGLVPAIEAERTLAIWAETPGSIGQTHRLDGEASTR